VIFDTLVPENLSSEDQSCSQSIKTHLYSAKCRKRIRCAIDDEIVHLT